MKYELNEGRELSIDLGSYVCKICHQPVKTHDKGVCSSCLELEDPFYIRLSCLFDRPDSALRRHGVCTRQKPNCGYDKNTRYCHTPYVLYIGRIGNIVKVGISRESRRGGYLSRLAEQGLNEAYVINGFENLEEVLRSERDLRSLGFRDRIYFREKIDSIQQQMIHPLHEDWDESLLNKYFGDRDIEFVEIYPDPQLEYAVEAGDPDSIRGKITHIQGPVIITRYQGQHYYWDLRKMIHREVITMEGKDHDYTGYH